MEEFTKENYEEALGFFLKARELEPQSTKVAYFLGLTYKKMENYKEAVPCLKDSVIHEPKIKEGLLDLIDTLTHLGEVDEAMKWVAVGEKEGMGSGKLYFLKGVALAREKKYREAIDSFEKAKESEPDLGQAADYQIATAYMSLAEWKQARTRLREVISADPDTELAASARQYEGQVSEKIEQEAPFHFATDFGYKYDTNVVVAPSSGPYADLLAQSISNQRDTALNLTVRAAYIAPFSFVGPFSFSAQYAVSADRYFRLDDFNSMTSALAVVPGYTFSTSSLTLPVTYSYTWLQRSKGDDFLNDINWYTDTRYFQQIGVAPTFRQSLGSKDMAEFSVGYLDNKYFVDLTSDFDLTTDPRENRDGHTSFGSIGWSHSFGGKSLFSAKYSYLDEETKGGNWSNRSNRFDLSFSAPIKGPWSYRLSGSAAFSNYNFNPTFDMKRVNNTYDGGVDLIYALAKNVDIIGRGEFIRDKSNISLYDYRRQIYSLTVEYRY